MSSVFTPISIFHLSRMILLSMENKYNRPIRIKSNHLESMDARLLEWTFTIKSLMINYQDVGMSSDLYHTHKHALCWL